MSLTPRVYGLAENGFDPLSIAHMLGITFAQVDEALRGIDIPDPAVLSSVIGAMVTLHTEDESGGRFFMPDLPDGFAGQSREPAHDQSCGPTKVAPGGVVCELNVQGSDQLLSPINLHLHVFNADHSESLSTFTPNSIDLKDQANQSVDLHGLLEAPTKTGTDLFLEGQEGEPPSPSGEKVLSTAGGVFYISFGASLEPAR